MLLAASLVFLFVAGWEAGFVFDAPTLPVTYVVARGGLDDLALIVYLFVALGEEQRGQTRGTGG